MKTSPSRVNGFTLIELLVVLVLVVLIASMGVTAFSRGIDQRDFESSFSNLLKTLRDKRKEAIEKQVITSWDATEHHVPDALRLSWDFGKNKNILKFYPSGSNTGGTITLHQESRHRSVDVNWLTGRIDAQ